jgi:hypothetical protein
MTRHTRRMRHVANAKKKRCTEVRYVPETYGYDGIAIDLDANESEAIVRSLRRSWDTPENRRGVANGRLSHGCLVAAGLRVVDALKAAGADG